MPSTRYWAVWIGSSIEIRAALTMPTGLSSKIKRIFNRPVKAGERMPNNIYINAEKDCVHRTVVELEQVHWKGGTVLGTTSRNKFIEAGGIDFPKDGIIEIGRLLRLRALRIERED